MPAQTATIEGPLRDRVNAQLAKVVHFLDPGDFAIKSLVHEADKLAKIDSGAASLLRAEISQLTGNLEEVEYWLENARKLNVRPTLIALLEALTTSNLGYFARAATLFDECLHDPSLLRSVLPLGMMLAAFGSLAKGIEMAERVHLEMGDMNQIRQAASSASAALERMGVSEGEVRAMLDVAGEVLRRHRIMWAYTEPVIRIVNDEEDAALLYQLYVPLDADQAFALTDEALSVMVERDLLRPGLAFSFLGAM